MVRILNYIISQFLSFFVRQSFIEKKIKSREARKIIELYSLNNYTRNFVKFRFWFGPLHEINRLAVKKGIILDLGSGEGILANFLAISFPKRKMIGVEINKNRVKEANKKIKNIKFMNKSVFDTKLPKADAIIVSHVLHHLGSKQRQEELIEICHQTLKENGELIVAEVDKELSLRYLFGWIVDILLVPIFFEKKFLDLKIYHRGKNAWMRLFEKHQFKIKRTEITKDRIYPEVIFVLVKK